MAKITNTFSRGMDQDSSKNKYDNQHYYEAENVRIFTQDGQTSGALEDMAGTLERLDLSGISGDPLNIVGHCVLRDNIIVFLTESDSGPSAALTDYIVQVPIEELESLTGTNKYTPLSTYLHSGGNVIYKGQLTLSETNPVQCIGRYENQYVQKIYWTDGYNKLRYLNIVYDSENNDLENIPIDRLEVIGDIDLVAPVINDFVNGELLSGKIQYAYQLYMVNGSQTAFSPASPLYHLVGPSDQAINSNDYHGSIVGYNTGKGLSIECTVESTRYTRLRLIAVHYSTYNNEPEIRIVEEVSLENTGVSQTAIVIDVGQTLGTITLEEFRVLSTSLFSPSVIGTKDNFLFAAGITEDSFDVDFDAKAYRFGGSGSTSYNPTPSAGARTARIYEEDGSYYDIDGTVAIPTWTYSGGGTGVWDDSEFDNADCINRFNDQANDGLSTFLYRYQTNGTTYGGEGPNVSFTFATKDVDVNTSSISSIIGEDGGGEISSYEGYSNPYLAGHEVGYRRDEVYRFGIVFFDKKGRSSFVKWICDIRMPGINSQHTDGTYPYDIEGSATGIGTIVYPVFTISNLPTDQDIVSWQIVRVKREDPDKSVITQGIVRQCLYDSPDYTHEPFANAPTGTHNYHQLMSPEIAFGGSLILRPTTDSFHHVADLTKASAFPTFTIGTPTMNVWVYETVSPGSNLGTTSIGTMGGGVTVRQTNTLSTIKSGVYYKVEKNDLEKSKCFVFERDTGTGSTIHQKPATSVPLVNYRRNVHESRYSGITYNSRTRNIYISASEVQEGNVSVNVFGGDTYVTMFDVLFNSIVDDTSPATPPESVWFICESDLNVALRRPSCISKNTNDNRSLSHDYLGTYTDGTEIFNQSEDYYEYDYVYSRENELKVFISQPFSWQQINESDVKILASMMKTNGEELDSWLRFPSLQAIEVDPQYGPVTALETVTDKLCFFQPKAFGVVSVNERALLQTTEISQLSLGVSGLLERFDYAKTNIGCSHWRHMVQSPNGLYWVDVIYHSMYKFTTGPSDISMMKGMDSWFKENVTDYTNLSKVLGESIHMFYDPEYYEICLVDNTSNKAIIFNELTDSYVTLTDAQPHYVINYLEKVLGTIDLDQFHRHDDFGAQRGNLYGTVRQSSITLLVNPSDTDVAVFNNFEWLTENLDSDVDQRDTFDSIAMWNDYQHSGTITLTVGENVKRRMRKWRFTIPRAVYQSNQGVQGSVLTERYARMRDSHLFVKLTYISDSATKQFVIHDIITSVTISNS